ncbi:MAG: class I SAM-dependent methyltransferase [Coleofasciculus sp. A1-SPW-01]|uniref:class I SAM-dependent methyltransferase n=1 Tax=Coleofasciculus sp. A1-SPW-01 TaxID=3070819 RepID=UPI003301B46A
MTSLQQQKRRNDVNIFNIKPWDEENSRIIRQYIQEHLSGSIKILEAGCGQKWDLNLQGIDYELTGIDLSQEALEIRKYKKKDLDKIIVGDLRTIELKEAEYDVIYSSYVLEHISDAEKVLDNMYNWLKPEGFLILRIPDAETVYGFLSKLSPFWLKILYKKYIQGRSNAGKPGYDPFPTVYEPFVSKSGIRNYCKKQGLNIKIEYSYAFDAKDIFKAYPFLGDVIVNTVGALSLGNLASNRTDLLYIIQKNVV